MKQKLLASLKKELENSFGRKVITSRDCIQLVEDIYHKTGETVNANTLRRFFGLVKAEYPASNSTLTILSKYCGFNSMEEIAEISSQDQGSPEISREEVSRYMVSLFRHTQLSGSEDRNFYPLVEQTIIFLERNPGLIDKFQREIARTATGQYYYYEKLPNTDRLNGYFGDGLRHYLREKNNDEGKVFAHSMQVYRYWLAGDDARLLQHFEAIPKPERSPRYPDHIMGRLIAARIYEAGVSRHPLDRILAEAKRQHGAIIAKREDSSFAFPDFEMMLCEALLLTGHFEEGAEYSWHARNYLSASGQDKPTFFDLWDAFASARREPGEKSTRGSEPHEFYHSVSRKYGMMIGLLAEKKRGRLNKAKQEQFADLLKDTGFKRLTQI